MNPLSAIPESLIPYGRTNYKARLGPTSMLAVPQGSLQISRDETSIRLESGLYGTIALALDPNDQTRVSADIAKEGKYSGRFFPENDAYVFEADSGHRLAIQAKADKVEIRFSGFGAIDAMKLFLKRE